MSIRAAVAIALLSTPLLAAAQSIPTAPSPFIEQQRQQERERALRERNERPVNERPPPEIPLEAKRIPESETACLRLERVALVGEQAPSFQWAIADLSGPDGDDSPLSRCLGVKGLDVVTGRVQQALIQRGWATTRVLAEPQDLLDGVFTITLVPGRITAIRLGPESSARVRDTPILAAAIPAEPSDLLNARDIEQGLENLKRAATADADIRIQASSAPDAGPGDSELIVSYVQPRILRGVVGMDDSGTEATGRYQGSLTLSADNPLV
jgi:hemolysin activation/secretion protein